MEYKDFSNCAFNPLEEKKMIDAFPQLEEIVVDKWRAERYIDKLIRYVIMVYDPKSPLIQFDINLNSRKRSAAKLCMLDSMQKDLLQQVYNNDYGEIFPDLVVSYLKTFCRSMEWAILSATEYKLWETISILMTPLKKDDNSKDVLANIGKKETILEEVEKDMSRIESYYKIIFGDDEDLQKIVKRIPISPKAIADLNGSHV